MRLYLGGNKLTGEHTGSLFVVLREAFSFPIIPIYLKHFCKDREQGGSMVSGMADVAGHRG